MHLTGLFIVILLIAAAVWFLRDAKPGDTNNGWPRIEWGSSRPPHSGCWGNAMHGEKSVATNILRKSASLRDESPGLSTTSS